MLTSIFSILHVSDQPNQPNLFNQTSVPKMGQKFDFWALFLHRRFQKLNKQNDKVLGYLSYYLLGGWVGS